MVFHKLRRMFGRPNPLKVCTPDMGMEELEKIISFDASVGDLFSPDLTISASDMPHVSHTDHRMVLITDTLAETQGVLQAIPKDTHVVVVDSLHDNLDTINRKIADTVTAAGGKISALAVLAHAEKGKVILGTDKIDLANANEYKPQLEALGKNLTHKGQIQLFGCSVAGDVYGQGLVEVISVATHADVFASTNTTGYGPDKDWTLEYSTNPGTQMNSVVDTEQLAALPLDLVAGDLIITKGNIGPISNDHTLVNLNSAFVLSNRDGTDATKGTSAVLLANPPPDYTQGWLRIDVDNVYANSIGVTVTKPSLNQIVLWGPTADRVTAVLGTLEGTLNSGFLGNAQILIYADYDDRSATAVDTLNLAVGPAPGEIDIHVPPASVTVNPNVTSPIAGVSITDADAGNTGTITVTLSASHGALTVQVPASTPGLTPVTYTNSNITFTDTLANVNTALAGLKYTPAPGFADNIDAITITAVDQNLGTDSAEIEVTVNPATGVITINPPETVPIEVPVNLTSHITGLRITDTAVMPTPSRENPTADFFTVMVAVDHGKLTTMEAQTTVTESQAGNLITNTNFVNIGPASQLSFKGPLQYVNISLAVLMYTPDEKYQGTTTPPPYPDTLYVTVADPLGNAASAQYGIEITNQRPTISPVSGTIPVYAGVSTAIPGITVGDPDIGSTNITVILSATYGNLTVPSQTNVFGNGTNTLVINDTLINVNIALAGLRYTGTYIGEDHIIITANDQTTPTPGVPVQPSDITITVSTLPLPAASDPVISVPGPQTVQENSSLAISGISVYDADIGADGKLTVAIALDEAFDCYFPNTLDLLEQRGAVVVDFSPLRDEHLPPQADVVYFGCGHPERYAAALSENHCMMAALRSHLCAGRRIYAEGGGAAYLCQQMETPQGEFRLMAGVLPAVARLERWPQAARPVEVTLARPTWLGAKGTRIRGYQNPMWRLEPLGRCAGFGAEPGLEYLLAGSFHAVGSLLHVDFAAEPALLEHFFRPAAGQVGSPSVPRTLPRK